MESALLLRVPHAMAEQLHRQLAEKEAAHNNNKSTGDDKSKEKSSGPSVKLTFFGADGSVGVQHGGGAGGSMRGQIVNLPTIIEAHKTFDNIHYYKCTDIAQMVVVQAPAPASAAAAAAAAAPSLNANPTRPKNANETAAGAAAAVPPPPIDYPHGLTPPTREIRPKRFERNTKVPIRIVREVDTMLSNMKENIPVHQFELVEDEEEVDSADEEEEEEEGMMDEGMIDEEAEEGEEGEGGGRTPAEATPGTRTDDRMAQRNQSSTPQVLLRTPGTQQRPASATPDVGVALAMRTLDTPFVSNRLASPNLGMGTPQFGRTDDELMPPPRTGDIHRARASMFASPAVHGDSDMTDVTLEGFHPSAAAASAAAGLSSAATAASASASALASASPPNLSMTINVDSVGDMFGTPTQPAQTQQPLDMSFLPETPHTPISGQLAFPGGGAAGGAASAAGAAAAAAPAAPPSAADVQRAQLADVVSRVERAQKEVAEAKNNLLKRKAEQKLQGLLQEKATIEASMQS